MILSFHKPQGRETDETDTPATDAPRPARTILVLFVIKVQPTEHSLVLCDLKRLPKQQPYWLLRVRAVFIQWCGQPGWSSLLVDKWLFRIIPEVVEWVYDPDLDKNRPGSGVFSLTRDFEKGSIDNSSPLVSSRLAAP